MAEKGPAKTTQQKRKAAAEGLREQKIEAYKKRIAHDAETISAIEDARNAMAETDIIGLAVTHRLFGAGTITEQARTTITVKFDSGNKRFIMPSSFIDGFLETTDADINSKFSQYQDMGAQIKSVKDDISAANRSIKALMKK